jgi:amino acid adenylation domain-containing protein
MSSATLGNPVIEFFARLRRMGVSLEIEGGNLKASAPPGVISAGLREELLRRKSELIAVLETGAERRPLSRPESRLWFLQASAPESAAYNVWKATRLSGRLDPPAMRSAIIEAIARHEILRTTYEVRDGVPEAAMHRQPRLDWAVEDIADEESARQAAAAEAARPFAIDRGPLIRVRVLRWRADEQIVLVVLHHLVSDGQSLNLLWSEVSLLYDAYQEGGRADLPELSLQYGDWAARQDLELASERAARSLAFWTGKLANPPAPLEFPGARRRPSRPSYRGRWETLPLSDTASASVRQLAAEERTTPFMVFLSAFLLLLHRSTGAADLAIGTPVSGRRDRDTEPLIGLFANMLALRFNLEGEPAFREWLRRVRDNCLEYFEHADTPLEDVVEALRIERNQAVPPLFQMAFLCDVFREASPYINVPLDNGSAKFDLTLSIEAGPSRAHCTLEYSTDIYEAPVARRILENFRALVEAAVESPDSACSRIPLPSAPPEAWRGAQTRYPAKPVHAVFEEAAEVHSSREALVCGSERVTYADLNRRANLLAEFLQAEGVRSGDTVAILMERSTEYVASLLAVLKCGGTWVPLAASDPPARTQALLEDCGAGIVLVEERLPRGFDPGRARALPLPRLKGRDPGNPAGSVPLDRPACIMYTSGSTGIPKGVLVRHRGILRLLFGVDYAELGPNVTTLFMAPLQFDASTFELFGAILHGGRCVIARQGFRGIEEFAELVKREGVNTCWLTASLFNAVVEQSVDALRPIRQLLTGGEALSPGHVHRALEALPETQIVNGYGPTETTTFACCYRIPRILDPAARSIPIGRPIPNTQALVLDRYMRPLPPCAVGELFIGGDGVAQGYLNAERLTAERFVCVPGLAECSGPLYRTGDLVYAGPDNLLYYVGRTDGQVKVRGYRVEPGEVESAMLRLPEIRQAAVVAKQEPSGAMSLIAYYVPRENGKLEEDRVLAALQRALPAYMVPSRAVPVAAIPLRPSGKLDRAALPEPPARAAKTNGLAHLNPTELLLLQIWHKLFPGRQISVEDDFFSLGGHSLMAVRLMAQVERQFGKRLPASVLFEAPTVRSLAALLAGDKHETRGKTEFAALQPLGDRPPLFFVGAGPKQRLFAQRLGSDQPCLSPVPRFHHDYGPAFLMDLATQYASDIRRCQAHGPYHLAGWSRCGLLALEIAQRLRSAGEPVALLILVDTYLPGRFRGIGVRERASAGAARAMRLLGVLGRLLAIVPREIRNGRIRHRLGEIAARVEQSGLGRRLWKLRSTILKKLLNRRVIIQGWHDLAWALATSAEAYVPRSYDSPVLFLLAEDKPAGPAFDPLPGWGQFLSKVDVERVPGDHETMFRAPNVDIVARAVSKYLS